MIEERLYYHLQNSVKAWHAFTEEMPINVEIICKEISKKYGKFLNVKRWLIIPGEKWFKECLVAEFDITINHLGENQLLKLHINHLIPYEKIKNKT